MAGRFIYVLCMQCQQEDSNVGKLPESVNYKLFNKNNETEHIQFKCERGHKNVIIIQELLFETLLNIAIEDITYRHYREAVFNFASAQERFFEFVIELLCLEKCLNFDELWKFMPLSERQLGAFVALYFARFNKKPFDINKKVPKTGGKTMVKLRNDIVHNGKTPTEQEAKYYANYVIENIYNIMKDLLEDIEPKLLFEFQSEKLRQTIEKRGEFPQDAIIITISNRIVSWRTASVDDLEQEQKPREWAQLHGDKKYADMAVKANEAGKALDIDDKGNLILIDPQNPFVKNPEAEYIGEKTIDDYILKIGLNQAHYNQVEKGLVEGSKVVDLTKS